MQGSSEVLFATSNGHKFEEAAEILGRFGIEIKMLEIALQEIQSDDLGEIVLHKVDRAFESCGRPVMVEDDGLFIDALGGFPGPYSSYVFKTLGNRGILRLLDGERSASFRATVAYRDARYRLFFKGNVDGVISRDTRGGGWGYDPIFAPLKGSGKFAEASSKNCISHRYLALREFAAWQARRSM